MVADIFRDYLSSGVGGVVGDAEVKVRSEANGLPAVHDVQLLAHSFILEQDGQFLTDHV